MKIKPNIISFVEIADQLGLAANAMSVVARFAPYSVDGEMMLANKFKSDPPYTGWYFEIYQAKLNVGMDGNRYFQSSEILVAGQRYAACFTWDSTTLKVYINGSLVDTITPNPVATITDPSGMSLLIGKYRNDFPLYFDGKLEEVEVINHVLTDAEAVVATS